MANGDVLKPEEITATLNKDADESDKTEKTEEIEKTEKTEEVEKEEKTETEDVTKSEPKEPLTKDTEARIIRQLEYYFGDINLPRDKFLKEQVLLDDGWVPLEVLLTFKRLSSLSSEADVIVDVVLKSDSSILEVSDDRKKIRRSPALPIPEYNDERRKELMTRTAYVKGFSREEKLEEIIKYFETYGPQEGINMRHYFDKATKKSIFKGSVFVIFKTIDLCKKFIEAEDVKYNDVPLLRKWQADYIEEKKLEREERNAKRGKGKKEQTTDDAGGNAAKKLKFPKGAILFMEGFSKEDTTRETIKKKITEIASTEPAFITFDKGNKDGYIRFSEENGAVEFVKKVTDNKLEIDGNDLVIRVLEGEEEEKFLDNLSDTLDKIRQQNKNSKGRGRKRRGFGDSGPRAKHNRK